MDEGLINSGKGTTTIKVYDLRNAYYQAGDPCRRLERLDSQLIGNDRTEIQNVPQEAKVTYFPGRPWRKN